MLPKERFSALATGEGTGKLTKRVNASYQPPRSQTPSARITSWPSPLGLTFPSSPTPWQVRKPHHLSLAFPKPAPEPSFLAASPSSALEKEREGCE